MKKHQVILVAVLSAAYASLWWACAMFAKAIPSEDHTWQPAWLLPIIATVVGFIVLYVEGFWERRRITA